MANIDHSPGLFDSIKEYVDVDVMEADSQVLYDRLPEYDVYYASLAVRLTEEMMVRSERLKVIVSSTTGFDHIDLDYAQKRGIEYLSLKYDTDFLDRVTATAEMAWCLLLATVRKLPWSFASVQKGNWERDNFRGMQISGKTFGILGYGRLGKIIAEYARGFRMNVIAHDILEKEPGEGVKMVDFDTLVRESDVLSIHIHMTEDNTGIMNKEVFQKMKNSAILLNTSRGAVFNEDDLLEALKNGDIGGAGIDIVVGEWRDDLEKHPLIEYSRSHQNLVISPHTGGITYESQSTTSFFMVEKLKKYIEANLK